MKQATFPAVFGVVLLALAQAGVLAQISDARTAGAVVIQPDDGTDVVNALASGWNVPPYDCSSGFGPAAQGQFIITKLPDQTAFGGCLHKQVKAVFDVDPPSTERYGLTYTVGCDEDTQRLTSWFGVCGPSEALEPVPCTCTGAAPPLSCALNSDFNEPLACDGTCDDAGTCSGNSCTGNPARSCTADVHCSFCNNQDSRLCTLDSDCDFGGCGAFVGTCSVQASGEDVACQPLQFDGDSTCTGICTTPTCVSPDNRCFNDPSVECASNDDCRRCSNVPSEPCSTHADCFFGSCDDSLQNIDGGSTFDFFVISVSTSPGASFTISILEGWRTGLLVVGLLGMGAVLAFRYARG